MILEYSCTNSTNQIAHCEVSKSYSETWVSLLSPQVLYLLELLFTANLKSMATNRLLYCTAALELQAVHAHISVYLVSVYVLLEVQRLQAPKEELAI